ncbi:uncharacterized protein LOC132756694 [Ruditapes philippinarum]|uniref:uncharacterized protein LOC132756694 n=1 Tax=Ruditapes philippinarum TaxID=129788 RepID=UPI00295B461C|nr:uncharacterized protein LOC132756694 [Ruditapes philippinarum]
MACLFCYIFVTVMINGLVLGFIVTNEDKGVKISYTIKFRNKCRGETDKIVTLQDVPLSECAMACGLRKACAALNYRRIFKLFDLYSSDGIETDRVKGSCVEIWKTDMFIEKQPCPDCDREMTCEPSSKTCESTECSLQTFIQHGMILGNLNEVGARREYICDIGYKLNSTDENLVCFPDGHWNNSMESCIREYTFCNSNWQWISS